MQVWLTGNRQRVLRCCWCSAAQRRGGCRSTTSIAQGLGSAAAGEIPDRRLATVEALFLARLVGGADAREPEAFGLLPLMLHAEARRPARLSVASAFVLLSEQDAKVWDAGMIGEAEALLHRASSADAFGRYRLEAALAIGARPSMPEGRQELGACHQLVGGAAGDQQVARCHAQSSCSGCGGARRCCRPRRNRHAVR
jgi:hypothetical protein